MEENKSKDRMDELEAMERLAKVMNDSPTIMKMAKTEFAITALKPGTQWLIAQEAVKICKAEKENFADVIRQFAVNIPSVIRVLTLAILNDKDKIYDEDKYRMVYDTIEWQTNPNEWIGLLVEIINMLSLDYFFDSTNAIAMLREMALGRKKTREERESLLQGQSSGK